MPKLKQDATDDSLSPKQVVALECLLTQTVDETLESVAARAGVSRTTLYRYLQDETFNTEFRSRVSAEFKRRRALVAKALMEGAIANGPGQAAMQKLYWQMLNEIKDSVEITGKDGSAIEVSSTSVVSLSDLSPETLKKIRDDLRQSRDVAPS